MTSLSANRLAHEVLGRSLDELPPQTRRLVLLGGRNGAPDMRAEKDRAAATSVSAARTCARSPGGAIRN